MSTLYVKVSFATTASGKPRAIRCVASFDPNVTAVNALYYCELSRSAANEVEARIAEFVKISGASKVERRIARNVLDRM